MNSDQIVGIFNKSKQIPAKKKGGDKVQIKKKV